MALIWQLVIDEYGTLITVIYFGFLLSFYCTCSQSGACAHIGALLFVSVEIVSSGLFKLPNELSCTDKISAWIQHRGNEIVTYFNILQCLYHVYFR